MYEPSDSGVVSDRRSRMRAIVLWGALAATGSCAPSLSAAPWVEGADSHYLLSQQFPVYTAQVPMAVPPMAGTQPLSVVAWVDRPDGTYALGEHVRLFVQTNREAYLSVLNVGPSGDTTLLFPNPHQAHIRVAAHEVTELPPPGSGASIRVNGPTGREVIKVIASTHPIPLSAWKSGSVPYIAPGAGSRTSERDLQMAPNGPATEWTDFTTIITTIGSRPQGTAPAVPLVPAHGTSWPSASFGLRVATDKSVYRIGEAVSVYASATAPCYLTLVNIGTSGQAHLLLPNASQPRTLIPAGHTVVFPVASSHLRLTPMGPPGKETVVAVCSADDRPLFPWELTDGRTGHDASRDLAVAGVGTSAHRPVDRATVDFMVTL